MEVEMISRETIKPSSPTPADKKVFLISAIDKVVPIQYINFVCYYSPNQTKNFENINQTLRESLSEALTIFYPFAGRLNADQTVDCNDNGVLFTTTRVNCKLADFLAGPNPNIESIYQLWPPLPPFCPDQPDRPSAIAVQVNEFSCGGLAICHDFFHTFVDAITYTAFLKCWSEIASKKKNVAKSCILPAVDMFPQGLNEPMPEGLSVKIESTLLREERGTIRRFVFDESAISTLKENSKSDVVKNPSRVEAVTAFLWKHMMEASEKVWGYKQPSILCQPIDIRRRIPSQPGYPIGNIVWKSIAHYRDTTSNKDDKLEKELVGSVRAAITEIKDEFIPKLLKNGAYETVRESLEDLKDLCMDKTLNPYQFSSWCKMGIKDIDFGWGEPIWISFMGGADVDPLYKNIVFLMDGETTDKIEAWVILDKQEMEIVENNPEFLAFTSANPPIFVES
jgi:shikimate O-hydroxycinnamoyltransferase